MHRAGPRGAGPQWRINGLERPRPLQNARYPLEVLAGAISWGFKSPSPHHNFNNLRPSSKSRCISSVVTDAALKDRGPKFTTVPL